MPQRMQGYTEFRGEPWPPAVAVRHESAPEPGEAHPPVTTPDPAAAGVAAFVPGPRMAGYTPFRGEPWPPAGAVREAGQPTATPAAAATAPGRPAVGVAAFVPGPRMAGYTPFRGEPWPPAGAVPAEEPGAGVEVAASAAEAPTAARSAAGSAASAVPTRAAEPAAPAAESAPSAPAPSAAPATSAEPSPTRSRGRRALAAAGGAVVLGLAAVLGARGLMSVPEVAAFVARHPGVPVHGEGTPVGIPAWVAAQHFLNAFLLALVVRTGLQIRGETRPPASFTPTRPGLFAPAASAGRKVSLTVWLHQALDVLWVLNGLVFVVLTLATGHWRRLIPTDPETPQHMASTALQYLTLDWPAHDGWLHYNALQMVSYAAVVFVLAPLAALTGLRMSTWWPEKNAALSRAFPIEVARRVHYPVMLAFVAFVAVHVVLVLLSGLFTELNGMFLARQAADAWGLVAFLAAVGATAGAAALLKPAVVAPVAERFGRVGR